MRVKNVEKLTATEAARGVAEGGLSPVDLIEACLDRIEKVDARVGAWVHVDAEGARATARERHQEATEKRLRGPLHGVPVAIKDVIDVAGMSTTCGAGSFAHLHPKEDATCVARLRAAGAIIVGKVTTTEFAYFEPSGTRNPWNLEHTPGGSSSGSAASVAAGMVPIALGSQTIGSVLRPAGFCGVVGFKGTRGAVPMTGSFPLARTLDHIGIFSRTIADARLVSDVLTGRPVKPKPSRAPHIALVPALIDRAESEVTTQIRAAADRLAEAGAHVTEIVLPESFASVHDTGRSILEGEFATYQEALYRANADQYRPRTRGLIDAGLAQKTTAYVRAQQARTRFKDDMMPVFEKSPILLTPVAAGTAPKGLNFTGDPWFCTPWSTIGVPALSMPIALGAHNLPHAIQLVAGDGADADLLDAAQWCESVLRFTDRAAA